MNSKNVFSIIGICAIGVFLFVSLGFLVGISYVTNDSTFFVFQNIIIISYGLASILTVIALNKYFTPISIILIIFNILILLGSLYFFEVKNSHRFLIALFIACLTYTIYYWIRFTIKRKNHEKIDDIKHINGVLPIVFIGFSTMMKIFRLLSFIETDIDIPVVFVGASVAISVIAVVLGIIFIKDRSDKKEYIGKLCAIFWVPMIVTMAFPLIFTEYTNYVFDSSVSEKIDCVVVDKYTRYHSKGRRSHYLVLRIDGDEIILAIDKLVYEKYEIGDVMPLYENDGAYNIPYYEYRLDSVYKYKN